MGNRQALYKDLNGMKSIKVLTPAEEDPTEKRKTSASVDEIRDLYSALQELVPSTSPQSSPQVLSPEKENNDVSDSGSRQNLAPRTFDQPKRSSSPLPPRTQQRIVTGRNRSHSLDAQMGFPNLNLSLRRDSRYGWNQGKRLLKTPTRIHEELHTIVKGFDETDVPGNRHRSRSMSTLLEPTGPLEERYHHYSTPSSRPRSFTGLYEESGTICEVDGGLFVRDKENYEIKDKRARSQSLDVLLETKGLSEDQSIHFRPRSFTGTCEEKQVSEYKRVVMEKDELNSRKNIDDIKTYFRTKKRLSAGDILERQRKRFTESSDRRRSVGGSLLLSALANSASSSCPTRRKGSLASALSLIARKTDLQEIIKTCQDKLLKEEKSHFNDETDHGDTKAVEKTETSASNDSLQKEVDILLASVKELVQQDSESVYTKQDSCEDVEDLRRGSIASVGTEMHNLLEALRDLIVCAGVEMTPSSTPAGSTTSSRRTSISEIRTGIPKESLEELEAYFKFKLENISEGDASSTATSPNTKENLPGSGCRRHSSPKVAPKEKVHPAKSSITPCQTMLLPPSSSCDMWKPSGAFRAQRHTEHNGSRIGNRRRSRSAQDIDLPERTKRMLANETRSYNRSPSSYSSSQQESDEAVQAQNRAIWKEDQLLFAEQVNKRLHDWLEKATALSLQDEQEVKAEDNTSIEEDCLDVSSDYEPIKKSQKKFTIKNVLRRKVRRSKSVNNLSEPEQPKHQQKSPRFKRGVRKKLKRSKSLQNIHDKEELTQAKPKSTPHVMRSPQSLLKIGRQRIFRSKTIHDVSKNPSLDSTKGRTTESDESFDEGNSKFFIQRNLSCEQTQRVVSRDQDGNNHETPMRHSCPETKVKGSSENIIFIKSPDKNSKLCTNGKRISRLPVNLPLFYAPGRDSPTLQTIKDNSSHGKRRNERKSVMQLRNSEASHALFYDEKPAITTALAAPDFSFLLSPVPSKGIDTSRPGSLSDEGYIKLPYQVRLNNSAFQEYFTEDTEDFRDRAKSTESEDSGCPDVTEI